MIQKISVFGAGTMGHGLAETFAMNGYPVRIYDVSEVARKNVKDAMRAELISQRKWGYYGRPGRGELGAHYGV